MEETGAVSGRRVADLRGKEAAGSRGDAGEQGVEASARGVQFSGSPLVEAVSRLRTL